MDDHPLMMYFYGGLKDTIKDEIYLEDRLEDISTYIEQAIYINNCQYKRHLEKQYSRWNYY